MNFMKRSAELQNLSNIHHLNILWNITDSSSTITWKTRKSARTRSHQHRGSTNGKGATSRRGIQGPHPTKYARWTNLETCLLRAESPGFLCKSNPSATTKTSLTFRPVTGRRPHNHNHHSSRHLHRRNRIDHPAMHRNRSPPSGPGDCLASSHRLGLLYGHSMCLRVGDARHWDGGIRE